jgi:hypothetical protein
VDQDQEVRLGAMQSKIDAHEKDIQRLRASTCKFSNQKKGPVAKVPAKPGLHFTAPNEDGCHPDNDNKTPICIVQAFTQTPQHWPNTSIVVSTKRDGQYADNTRGASIPVKKKGPHLLKVNGSATQAKRNRPDTPATKSTSNPTKAEGPQSPATNGTARKVNGEGAHLPTTNGTFSTDTGTYGPASGTERSVNILNRISVHDLPFESSLRNGIGSSSHRAKSSDLLDILGYTEPSSLPGNLGSAIPAELNSNANRHQSPEAFDTESNNARDSYDMIHPPGQSANPQSWWSNLYVIPRRRVVYPRNIIEGLDHMA